MNTREKGNIGEDKATEHLQSLGYDILQRNYRTRSGEIDIVAKAQNGTLVFVEVKSALNDSFGNPLYKITPSKQRTIVRTAKQYMCKHKITNTPCRFDVIGICGGKLDHIKNAFWAS